MPSHLPSSSTTATSYWLDIVYGNAERHGHALSFAQFKYNGNLCYRIYQTYQSEYGFPDALKPTGRFTPDRNGNLSHKQMTTLLQVCIEISKATTWTDKLVDGLEAITGVRHEEFQKPGETSRTEGGFNLRYVGFRFLSNWVGFPTKPKLDFLEVVDDDTFYTKRPKDSTAPFIVVDSD